MVHERSQAWKEVPCVSPGEIPRTGEQVHTDEQIYRLSRVSGNGGWVVMA